MRYYHTKCGGEIDVKNRQCRRCKKRWDPLLFRLDPMGIRPMLDSKGRPLPNKVRPRKAQYKRPDWIPLFVPLPEAFIARLPNWPRWARIATTVGLIGLVFLITYLVRR